MKWLKGLKGLKVCKREGEEGCHVLWPGAAPCQATVISKDFLIKYKEQRQVTSAVRSCIEYGNIEEGNLILYLPPYHNNSAGERTNKILRMRSKVKNQQHTWIVLVARRQAGRNMAGQALGQSRELRMSCGEGHQHVGQHAWKVFRDGILKLFGSPGIDFKDQLRQPM